MKRLVVFLVALMSAVPACAQVQQSGSVTANHYSYWVTSDVIGDAGSAIDSPITSMGVTNNGGAAICVSSARQVAAGRNQLCLSVSTTAAATISLQNYGTAAAQALNFVVNGVTISLPTGGGGGGTSIPTSTGPFVTGDAACWSATAANLIDCGALALGSGGTGGTTAASARTNLGLGTMSQQNAASVTITGGSITGMPTPANPTDVAIKSYVDGLASGLIILAPSTLATAAVLPNTPTYANGASGVGATLTAGSNTTLTVDGTAAPLNTIVLVKNQAAPAQNGIYKVTTAGDGSNAWVLTRATYFDQAAEMLAGSYTFVTAGSTNANNSYVLTATVTTVGTTAANFNQFSQASGVSSLGGLTGAIGLGTGLGTSGPNITNTGITSFNSLTGAVTTNVVVQKFTATGTYTPTSGMLHAIVECIGPGGGGGGAAGTVGSIFIAGGGSSGSYSMKRIVAADIVTNAAVTIPAGGAGAAAGANSGSAGVGATTVVSNSVTLCSGTAGNGGGAGSVSLVGQGGNPAAAGTGDVTGQGNPGGSGLYSSNTSIAQPAGAGGSSVFGGGAIANFCSGGTTAAGTAGGNYGGGGAGGCASNTAGTVGGSAGSAGIVIVTEFVNM